jgi:hypothetical protein
MQKTQESLLYLVFILLNVFIIYWTYYTTQATGRIPRSSVEYYVQSPWVHSSISNESRHKEWQHVFSPPVSSSLLFIFAVDGWIQHSHEFWLVKLQDLCNINGRTYLLQVTIDSNSGSLGSLLNVRRHGHMRLKRLFRPFEHFLSLTLPHWTHQLWRMKEWRVNIHY